MHRMRLKINTPIKYISMPLSGIQTLFLIEHLYHVQHKPFALIALNELLWKTLSEPFLKSFVTFIFDSK